MILDLIIGAFVALVEFGLRALVRVHYGARGAVNQSCGLVAAIFLHGRNLKLKVLRLFSSRDTSGFLLCFETRKKGVIVASDGRPASQLPVQLKLVALDVFGALGVVAV